MSEKNYLTEEEQYKRTLNNEEISRIKDPKLREIRENYWREKHKAFLNEHAIPDSELDEFCNKIESREKKELDKYRESLKVDNKNK